MGLILDPSVLIAAEKSVWISLRSSPRIQTKLFSRRIRQA
jgi:hypothetical protein